MAADSGRHPSRPRRRRRPGPLRRRGGRLHDAADQVRPRRGARRPCRAPPTGGRASSRRPGRGAAAPGPGALTGPGPARTAGPAGAEAGRGGGGERGGGRRGRLDASHPRADHRGSHLATAHRPARPRPTVLTGPAQAVLGTGPAAPLGRGRSTVRFRAAGKSGPGYRRQPRSGPVATGRAGSVTQCDQEPT